MNEDYWIPRKLDAPPLFFMWETDVAMLVIITILICASINIFVFGIILSYFLAKGFAYLKEEGGKGLIMKIIFWYTPSSFWLSKRNPSHIREYVSG